MGKYAVKMADRDREIVRLKAVNDQLRAANREQSDLIDELKIETDNRAKELRDSDDLCEELRKDLKASIEDRKLLAHRIVDLEATASARPPAEPDMFESAE